MRKKTLRTVRLRIGFDGTRYEGWQSQNHGNTIQQIFEKNLSRIFSGEKIDLIGSSRTDSGVHAKGFVAHFLTKGALPDDKIKDALNFHLPRDIIVYEALTVKSGFHARYDAKAKIYRYDVWNDRTRPLFEAPYVFWYPGTVDLARMRKAARCLVGKHDFRAFKDSGDDKKNTVRTVKSLRIAKKGSLLSITVEGDGFLTHMVRVIAGTLLEVGRGKIRAEDVADILRSRDRKKAGPTAKALGLTLVEVIY